MKPRAEALSELPQPTRFIDRADVKNELVSLENGLKDLNEGLDHPTLNGTALYGLKLSENPDDLLSIAGTIALANVDNVEQRRLHFAENTILRRKTLVEATRFGENLDKPVYGFSKMNIEEDFTYSYPLLGEDSKMTIGIIQHAFHYPGNMLPEEDELRAFKEANQPKIDQITRSLRWLYEAEPDLLTGLELAPAVTPNRYAIRWDITNENLLRQIDYGTYLRYLQHSKQITQSIVSTHCPTALLASIDDRNIIIEFPKYIKRDLNDTVEIKLFQNRDIAKLAESLQQAHNNLAESYKNAFIPNLNPRVRVSFGNGLFEDVEGKLQSPLLTTMKRQNLSS